MGRSSAGCYKALQFFGIPVLSMLFGGSFISTCSILGSLCVFLYISVLGGSSALNSVCALVGSILNSMVGGVRQATALVRSVFCRSPRRGGPSRSSNRRYARFRRRQLHYHLFRKCLRRKPDLRLLGKRVRQHRRWRRRKARWRRTYTVKRRELKRQLFLTPLRSGRSVWNEIRHVDSKFLSSECTSFEPHAAFGVVPDELLDEFCCERGATFLSAIKLMQNFGTLSLE